MRCIIMDNLVCALGSALGGVGEWYKCRSKGIMGGRVGDTIFVGIEEVVVRSRMWLLWLR